VVHFIHKFIQWIWPGMPDQDTIDNYIKEVAAL
jgi:hypothetical protein